MFNIKANCIQKQIVLKGNTYRIENITHEEQRCSFFK